MIDQNIQIHTNLHGPSPNTWKLWQFAVRYSKNVTAVLAVLAAAVLSACEAMPPVRLEVGEPAPIPPRYVSYVVTDEAQAALVARSVLSSGGNAADAAVAIGFSLAVTLPSSAGLGGSGACMIHDLSAGSAEALDFLAPGVSSSVPRLARGLFSLHARYGSLPWSQVVSPAENLARFGHPVSQALAHDLEAYGSRLLSDRTALDIFMSPQRNMLQAGDQLRQPQLASTLATIRTRFPNNFKSGSYENEMARSVAKTLGVVLPDTSRTQVPEWKAAAAIDERNMQLFMFESRNGPVQDNTSRSELSVLSEQRMEQHSGSTGFIVADARRKAAACVLTMGEPFGLGIVPQRLGFLVASGVSEGTAAGAPFAISFLVDRSMRYVALAATSSDPGALRKVMYAVDGIKRSVQLPDGVENKGATNAHAQAGVNIVYCEKDSSVEPVRCRALARSNRYGYAAVIGPRK